MSESNADYPSKETEMGISSEEGGEDAVYSEIFAGTSSVKSPASPPSIHTRKTFRFQSENDVYSHSESDDTKVESQNSLDKSESEQEKVPERDLSFLNWTAEDVGTWIKNLGFPCYESCFVLNYISGKKLIVVTASTLCRMGIRNFEDIKYIANEIRELIYLEYPEWNRSISLPPRSDWGMFLEKKSFTGAESEQLDFEKFQEGIADKVWKPPLDNFGKVFSTRPNTPAVNKRESSSCSGKSSVSSLNDTST